MPGAGAVTGAAAPPASPARPSDSVLGRAVHWRVRFESGAMTPAERRAFERWRGADPSHAQAWQMVGSALADPLAVVRELGRRAPGQAQAAHQALLKSRRRRMLGGTLALAGAAAGGALLADRRVPLAQLMADLSTSTGQRRDFALPDGSSVLLNARSAVDADFAADARRLRLRVGELIATAVFDPARPFVVETGQGSVRASQGRFLVGQRGQAVQAVALAGGLEVRGRSGERASLRGGQGAWLAAGRIVPMPGDAQSRAAWEGGMLAVDDAPLEEVVDALRAYYAGFIRLAPAARRLRVFGVFPLADTEQALQALAHTLPLAVRRRGWLVTIDLLAAGT